MNTRHLPARCLALAVLITALNLPALAQGSFDEFKTAEVCAAHPMIDVQGTLVWGEDRENSKIAPFDLKCSDVSFFSGGGTVRVQARDIFAAQAAFTEDALLLSYYNESKMHLHPDGRISIDPVQDVPYYLTNEVNAIVVKVVQDKTETLLLKNGRTAEAQVSLTRPFTFSVEAGELELPWSSVLFIPSSGTIIATLKPVP